jgi:hypothetical protein
MRAVLRFLPKSSIIEAVEAPSPISTTPICLNHPDRTAQCVWEGNGANHSLQEKAWIQTGTVAHAFRGIRDTHQLAILCSVQEHDRHRLLTQAASLGLTQDEIALSGFAKEDDLVNLYNLCKLFVIHSSQEGFGLRVLEAVAYGEAVVGANTTFPKLLGAPML